MEGEIIFDQDDAVRERRGHAAVDAGRGGDPETPVRPLRSSTGLPLIATTPTEPFERSPDSSRALPRPGRRERKARRKDRIRSRRTWVGRHPKTVVLLVIVVLLTPVWVSAGSAATNPANGNTVGARLTEWVRDHGGGGVVTWAENTWYTLNPPPKGGKPAKGAIPAPVHSHRSDDAGGTGPSGGAGRHRPVRGHAPAR